MKQKKLEIKGMESKNSAVKNDKKKISTGQKSGFGRTATTKLNFNDATVRQHQKYS